MNNLKLIIEEKFCNLRTPQGFAQVIHDLGFELMDTGQLDSDELLWEVGRAQWKNYGPGFEKQVYDLFEVILEQS